MSNRRGLVLALFVASNFITSVAFAQELSTVLPRDPHVIYGTLPNGLTYYVRQNHKPEKRVEIRLAVKAGSILEDDDQQGLAHMTEHMAFNGTKKWPKNDLINFLESSGVRFGAHLNAYTSFDETVYMLQLPTDKPDVLSKGLDVLSEWAHGLAFDHTEIDKERGVVVEEWRLGRGANERIENKQLPVILNHSHHADRITIGLKPVLDTFKYSTLTRFYHDWYRPDLMAVVVVGDIDPDQMVAEIKKLFAPIENPVNERLRMQYTVPPHSETLVSVETDKELTAPSFDFYVLTPQKEDKTVADYRSDLISDLCDLMFQQRMQEITQKGNPPFAGAYSREGHFVDHTHSYTLSAILKPDSILNGIAAVLREGYRAKNEGFTPGELERAKSSLMTSIENSYNEREKTNSAAFIRELTSNFLVGEPFPGIEYERDIYKKYLSGVSLAEVNERAKTRMENGSVAMSLEAPQSDTIRVPTKEDLLALLDKVKNEHLAAYVDKSSDEPLIAVPPTPGKVVSERKIAALGVTEWTLSNGAKVMLKPTDFKADEIRFEALAPGGTSLASDNDILSSQIATTLISQSGLGNFDLSMLQKKMAGKTVSVRPFMNSLQEGFTGSSSKRDMQTLFQETYLYFTAPRFDTDACHAFLSKMGSMMQNMKRNPQSALEDTMLVTMSQYSPRSRPIGPDRLKEIQPQQSFQFFRDRFADAGHFTFFIVGSFELDKIRPLVEQYLASLPATNVHETFRDDGINPPTGVIEKHVYKGVEPKSSVRINITGPFAWSLQNRFDIAELAEVLSIKLREDLREDKSGVYGISVRAVPERFPQSRYTFAVNFGCDPARVDELVGEVMKQIDTAMMRPFDTIYIHKVQEIQRGELETGLKENDFWLTGLSTYYSINEDPIHILDRKSMIDKLTADNVQQFAKKYLDRKNMVTVELFPEQKTDAKTN
jgi:zinc protease